MTGSGHISIVMTGRFNVKINPESVTFSILMLALLLLAGYVIYSPGLTGGFIYDDISNIVDDNDLLFKELNPNNLIKAATSGISSEIGRPVSMLTFALNVYFSGYDPYAMKLTNLLIHLLNGILVYVFITQLLSIIPGYSASRHGQNKTSLIALAITSAWLFHPLNLTGVLYIVQRMNLLSFFFVLLGMLAYLEGRQKILRGERWIGLMIFSTFICGGLATLSKENGLLIFLYLFLIEFIFLQFSANSKIARYSIMSFFAFVAIIIAGGLGYLVIINPDFLIGGYQGREFNLYERLLTETRVLWFYIYLVLMPNPKLMGMHHDDMEISTSLLAPMTTMPSLLGLVALVILAIMLRKREPVISFGLLFFFAGHSMESTIIPLELVFEHRNYLPSIGIIFIIFYYLLNNQIFEKIRNFKAIAALTLIIMFAFITHVRAREWGDPLMLRFHELERNPDSARSAYEVGRFYASALDSGTVNDRAMIYTRAEFYFKRTLELQPGNIEALAGLVILSSSNGNPVEPEWLGSLIYNLESSPLHFTGVSAFNALLNCKENLGCDIEDNYIKTMIESVQKNSHIRPQVAAVLYYNLGLYYLNNFSDFNSARIYAEKAIAEKPDDKSAAQLLKYIITHTNDENHKSN